MTGPRMTLTLTCYPLLNDCGLEEVWEGDTLREIVEQVAADGWDYQAPACPEHKAVVNQVSGEYFRKGKCAACGKSGVERTKTFSGATLEECNEAAEAWARQPLKHKRCE